MSKDHRSPTSSKACATGQYLSVYLCHIFLFLKDTIKRYYVDIKSITRYFGMCKTVPALKLCDEDFTETDGLPNRQNNEGKTSVITRKIGHILVKIFFNCPLVNSSYRVDNKIKEIL